MVAARHRRRRALIRRDLSRQCVDLGSVAGATWVLSGRQLLWEPLPGVQVLVAEGVEVLGGAWCWRGRGHLLVDKRTGSRCMLGGAVACSNWRGLLVRRRPRERVTLIPVAVVTVTRLVALVTGCLWSPDGRGNPVPSIPTTPTSRGVGVVTSPSSGPPRSVATATGAAGEGRARTAGSCHFFYCVNEGAIHPHHYTVVATTGVARVRVVRGVRVVVCGV